jgi:sulfite exporter TauE/SafE
MAVSGGLLVGTVAKYNERIGNDETSAKRFAPTMLFVGGRLASYVILGGVIASVGKVLDPSPLAYGVIILIAAVVMIFLGLDMLHLLPHPLKRLMPRMPSSIGRRIMAAESSKHPLAPFFLGAATFFLPCGFTQALQIYALSVGSFVGGAMVLGAFALGTAPALLALGWASGAFRGGFKRFFFMFAGTAIILLGITNLVNGLSVIGINIPAPSASLNNDSVATGINIIDGVQVVTMKAYTNGYEPNILTLRAGMRTRWEIDAAAAAGCVRSLVSRPLGINQVLTAGPNVIEFVAPKKPGTYPFSCSMGMYRGTFNVIE